MKYISLLLFSTLFGFQQPAETYELKVVLTNINKLEGDIKFGIFNNSKTFLNKGQEVIAFSKTASSHTMTFNVKNLEKGDYAIAIYHDINKDNKCNLSWIFRPIEPYAFSNNIKLGFFKPSFDECKFTLDGDKTISIKLIE